MIDVIRFISLSILVLPSNTMSCVRHYLNKDYGGIDKIVDKSTVREGMHNVPSEHKRHVCYHNTKQLKDSFDGKESSYSKSFH